MLLDAGKLARNFSLVPLPRTYGALLVNSPVHSLNHLESYFKLSSKILATILQIPQSIQLSA